MAKRPFLESLENGARDFSCDVGSSMFITKEVLLKTKIFILKAIYGLGDVSCDDARAL